MKKQIVCLYLNQSNIRIGFYILIKWILEGILAEIEIVMIEAALEKTDGMVSQASDALKLRRTTLMKK